MFFNLSHSRVVLIAVLSLNLCVGYYTYNQCRDEHGGERHLLSQMGTMLKMVHLIRENYVDIDSITTEMLLKDAMKGMTKGLDKHSELLPPVEAKGIKSALSGKMEGIGVNITKCNEKLIIVHVMENSPAEKAGIQPNDEITAVNGNEIGKKSADELIQQISGDAGTHVKITIARHGETPEQTEKKTLDIERSCIPIISTGRARILPGTNCAYIAIYNFIDGMPEQLADKLSRLLKEHPETEGIILDLRENGGGLLTGAAGVCSLFLPEGEFIVSAQGGRNRYSVPDETKYRARGGYKVPDTIKLAVLINKHSASASEITAGCLQDLKRATIVGEKSYGKGSVQQMLEVGGGNLLKLTIARYHTPNRERIIDGTGINPDVECIIEESQQLEIYKNMYLEQSEPGNDPQIKAALDALKHH